MELKDAKYLDSILVRGGTSVINVDDVPDNIIRMLATYRYIRIVDKRSDGIAYLVETTDEGGQFLARGGFQGLIKESNEINIAKWPIGGTTNGDEEMSFDEAIERMITAYKGRIESVDSAINTL